MPGGDFHPYLFVIVAAWVLVCALGVVALKKVMYSAVAMVLCFLGVAFAYALLHAELLAVVQILVYVGAISIVVIFAIMLTDVQSGGLRLFFNRQAIVAAVVAVAAAAAIVAAIVADDLSEATAKVRNPAVREFSRLLFDQYVFPFEAISLVLLAAIIGAIVLARGQEERR
ncbi:MAG: NADH-quinone oxidoreductase subunit J [Thermoleophilia bacterium]